MKIKKKYKSDAYKTKWRKCRGRRKEEEEGAGRNGTNKVSDEELIAALKNTKTIRQALLFVGLAAKGGNYKRAKDLSQRNR